MSTNKPKSQYTESFNEALQWMWGDGYLAPGGSEEVAELLKGVDVSGRDVLDIGCGLGVIAVLLTQTYGAKTVVGIDVESHLIEHSTKRAARAGVDDTVSFQLVEPGPLDFADDSFDVVFTKDVIVHVPDKPAFYKDILRVLKPGGVFVGSDWLRGGEATYTKRAAEWLEFVHLNFQMKDIVHTQQAIEQAGFQSVRMNDRNKWYVSEVKKELETLQGEKFAGLVERIGEDEANYRLQSSTLKQQAIEDGFLRPTHFVGYKPL